jgi:hypothetical protein
MSIPIRAPLWRHGQCDASLSDSAWTDECDQAGRTAGRRHQLAHCGNILLPTEQGCRPHEQAVPSHRRGVCVGWPPCLGRPLLGACRGKQPVALGRTRTHRLC